jgi:hypothetical protein
MYDFIMMIRHNIFRVNKSLKNVEELLEVLLVEEEPVLKQISHPQHNMQIKISLPHNNRSNRNHNKSNQNKKNKHNSLNNKKQQDPRLKLTQNEKM